MVEVVAVVMGAEVDMAITTSPATEGQEPEVLGDGAARPSNPTVILVIRERTASQQEDTAPKLQSEVLPLQHTRSVAAAWATVHTSNLRTEAIPTMPELAAMEDLPHMDTEVR